MINQYNFLTTWLKAHTKSERGAAMVEYALLVALIAIVAIAALQLLGGTVSENFDTINNELVENRPAGGDAPAEAPAGGAG